MSIKSEPCTPSNRSFNLKMNESDINITQTKVRIEKKFITELNLIKKEGPEDLYNSRISN